MKSSLRVGVIALSLFLFGAIPEAMKLLNEGVAYAKRGDLKRAEELISRAIAIDPHEAPDYQVHFWHGVVLSGLGDEAAAKKEFAVAGHTPELNRRLVAMKAITPQQRAENARSDAAFLNAHQTKSFRAAEDAMKAGKFEEAQTLYSRSVSEPRPQLLTASHPPPDVFAEIKKEFENLSPGTVAFNAPDKMKVSETETVTVRIAPKGEGSGITGGLSGQTSTASQEHITPNMAAKLDGIGFEITPLSPETQSVAGGGFAEWRWNVTATDSGDHDLNLTIIAKLDQLERSVGTQTHRVHVEGDPMGAFRDFFEKNWQWLASAIVIPLLALLWKSRSKRKED